MFSQIFSIQSAADGLAGAFGSVVSMLLLYPLDNLRTLMQVTKGKGKGEKYDHSDAKLDISSRSKSPSKGNSVNTKTNDITNTEEFELKELQFSDNEINDNENDNDNEIISDFDITPKKKNVTTIPSLSHPSSSSSSSSLSPSPSSSSPLPPPLEFSSAYSLLLSLLRREGISGLYRGLNSALVGVGVSSLVYFFWYSVLKSLMLKQRGKTALTAKDNIIVATIAGVMNVFITAPIWVINTRITVQHPFVNTSSLSDSSSSYPPPRLTILSVAKDVLRHEGPFGFYKGLLPSLFLVSNPVIQFVFYEQSVTYLSLRHNVKRENLPNIYYFLLGALSKSLATLSTYPSQVVKSKLQAERHRHLGVMEVIREMMEDESFPAPFFRGMAPKMTQTVLNAAFTFLVYERITRIFAKILRAMKQFVMMTKQHQQLIQ